MSSPSNSPPYSHANVKYKTYQSKRNSVGSVSSLNAPTLPAGPTPPPSSNEPSARKRASSFARPAARPQNNPPVTSPGSSNLPLSSTGQNVAPIRTTLHQINGPSPLGRANPSTNDLDRFPKSPPPSASPKPFFAGLQSPNPTVSSLPASRSITPPTTAFNTPSRPQQKAPYLAGFQAKGAVRIRTEEFHTARQSGSEGKKLEQARLQRRLEKLVDIHFPHPSTTDSLPPALSEKPTHELAHALKSKPTATELWSSVRRSLKGPTLRHAEDVRTAEQRIVHWTDDREAHICVICGLPFSITVRKHHCRLCGRVVCYVPPNSHPAPISKDARCSTHFIYDWLDANDRGKGGVVTELQDPSSLTEEQEAAQAASCPSTVRSCRECLDSLLRDQSAKFPAPVPTWLKLHRVLLQTQDDIERTLPALQEQLLNPGNSPAALLATRKKILALLANYDALARRIRDLPLAEGQSAGGSQERLQRAIATRASTYLSEQMGLLKGLGSFEDLHSDATSSASSSVSRNDPPSPSTSARRTKHINENDRTDISKGARELQERADKLAVLVEGRQEQLVESYLVQAKAKRQLVDAASLQSSLDELKLEIQALQSA